MRKQAEEQAGNGSDGKRSTRATVKHETEAAANAANLKANLVIHPNLEQAGETGVTQMQLVNKHTMSHKRMTSSSGWWTRELQECGR